MISSLPKGPSHACLPANNRLGELSCFLLPGLQGRASGLLCGCSLWTSRMVLGPHRARWVGRGFSVGEGQPGCDKPWTLHLARLTTTGEYLLKLCAHAFAPAFVPYSDDHERRACKLTNPLIYVPGTHVFWLTSKLILMDVPAAHHALQIDILESVNSMQTITQGIHFGGVSGARVMNMQYTNQPDNSPWSNSFHTYAVDWAPNNIACKQPLLPCVETTCHMLILTFACWGG